MSRRDAFWHGFGWGCVGGLALVALMYLANLILGLRPLTQLLNEPLLALMPGFVFGFLIAWISASERIGGRDRSLLVRRYPGRARVREIFERIVALVPTRKGVPARVRLFLDAARAAMDPPPWRK